MAFLDKDGLEHLWSKITAKLAGKSDTGHSHSNATTSAAGFMSTSDKSKLDGIAAGAQVNTITGVKGNSENSYRTGNVNITAANIGLGNVNNTSDANKPVSSAQQSAIDSASASALSSAKTYADGLNTAMDTRMDAAESKLSGIADGANKTTVDSALSSTSTNPVQNKVINSALSGKVPTTRTVNGKDLSSNISLTASDVGADASGSAANALASAKSYADSAAATVKNDLLNGAGTAYDTLKELGDLIDDNKDAIDALETVAAGKANASHTHGNITNAGAIGTAANKAVITTTNGVLTTGTVPVASGGTGSTTAAGALTNLGLTATAAEINKLDGVTATTAELNYVDGVTSNIQSQLDSKAASDHSHTITASASDDDIVVLTGTNGTNKVTYSASHAASGATAGSYGDSSAQTPAHGGSFKVPYVTVNATGHVTGISAHNVTLPAAQTLSSLGVTATAAELNKLDGVTATTAELNYVDGVTSSIQSQIDGKASSNHNHIYYGVCETAADTVAKTVTVDNFELVTGAMVIVKFINSNSASSPTLNVNSTGAKPIYRYGTTAVSTGTTTTGWTAGAVQMFVYDGTGWVRDYWNNTTYSNASLGCGYVTCSTAAATVAKTASLSSYSLTTGGIVAVKFTYDVPASATLNINSKGAKSIYYNGAAITAGVIKAGDTATFVYSSQYHLISINRDPYTKAEVDSALSGKAASSHDHSADNITSGTLGVARGGTGKATHTSNAVLTGNGTSAVKNVATASGAFYATSANGAAKFGTLPVAQGGTGATTAAAARTNLGAAASDVITVSSTEPTSSTCMIWVQI